DGDSGLLQESLLFLLKQPLIPSSDMPMQSFQVPFEDPNLEPLPFRQEQRSKVFQIHQSQDQSVTNLVHTKPYTGNPIVGVGNKRVSQDATSQHSDDDSSYDRQSPRSQGDGKPARFRPYQDKKWKGSFQRLLKFKHKFGHCCVPHLYPEDPALGRWVKRQRQEYQKLKSSGSRTSNLTTSRIEELESIGFVWHAHTVAWLEKVDELKDFKRLTGHCNVPSNYTKNTALATWVKSQRRQYKLLVSGLSSTMSKDRYLVLQALGFVFVCRKVQTGIDSKR
ncbi:MAG: hypothetical protein SGBAC_008051, partial [Bacillariaceae sp.]